MWLRKSRGGNTFFATQSTTRRRRRPLFLERLEDRVTPTALLVNNATDAHVANELSLREALTTANTDAAHGVSDTISFASALSGTFSGDTIGLTQGQLVLGQGGTGTGTITIDGSSLANPISISGKSASRVFEVLTGARAVLDGIRITAGNVTGNGGGILNQGTLTLDQCAIVSNTAIAGNSMAGAGGGIENLGALIVIDTDIGANTAAIGGGIDNQGTATVSDSTIGGNSATGASGGGIENAAAGTMTVSNSTISGNSVSGGTTTDGGGIADLGRLTLSNSTITGNTATASVNGVAFGGGLYDNGTVALANCTVTNNTLVGATAVGGGIFFANGGTMVNTIVSGNTRSDVVDVKSSVVQSHDLIGAGADIAAAGAYGGPTETVALLPGSQALNAGGAVTTLAAAASAGATTLKVATGTGILIASTPGSYQIQVGGQDLVATAVSSDTLTLQKPLTAAITNGASVFLTTDQRGIIRPASADVGAFQTQIQNQQGQDQPDALVVTTALDSVANSPLGNVAGGFFGQVTLRDAVTLANVLNGATITFAAGLFGETIGLNPNVGELVLASNMTITGPGAGNLAVSGLNQSSIAFIDGSPGTTVTISGLTFTAADQALVNESGNTLILQDAILTGNIAGAEGAAIYNYGPGNSTSAGNVEIQSCIISDNSAEHSGAGVSNHGTMSITNSIITGNSSSGTGWRGGGIFSYGSLTLTDTIISDNTATESGGGVYVESGTVTVSDSTISGNTAVNEGGGIFSQGNLTLVDSTISGNITGAGPGQGYGGGIYNGVDGNATLLGCTISGNTAAINGGGLDSYESTSALLNCTISGNIAGTRGGGISNYGANVTVNDCTIAFNQAGTLGGGIRTSGSSSHPGTTNLFNTLLGDNTEGNGAPNDLGTQAHGTVNAQFSFIQNGAAGINGTNTSNITGQDPQLDPAGLSNNGGPTQTIALLPLSPAIAAGGALDTLAAGLSASVSDTSVTVNAPFPIPNPPAGTGFLILVGSEEMLVTAVSGTTLTVERGAGPSPITTHNQNDPIFLAVDQRGAPRPDSAPDIGAFQSRPPADHLVLTAPTQAIVGGKITVTAETANPDGLIDPFFTGTVALSLTTAPAHGKLAGVVIVPVVHGVATFSNLSFSTVGSYQLFAASSANLIVGTATVNVVAAPKFKVTLTPTGTDAAGQVFTVNVTAQVNGATETGYLGTIHFTSSDPRASLPANYTFQPGDSGHASFSVTLRTAGKQTVSVADVTLATANGTSKPLTLKGPSVSTPVDHFKITGFPTNDVSGQSHTVTVTAVDAFGNTVTSFTGKITLSSSDATAKFSSGTLQAKKGVASATVTLTTPGQQFIAADSNGILGIEPNITVVSAATHLGVTTTTQVTAGTPVNVQVKGLTVSGATDTQFADNLLVTSSDHQALISLTSNSGGVEKFSVTLFTAGSQTITVTDLTRPALHAPKQTISVSPGGAFKLTVTGFPTTTLAGTTHSFTVKAVDQYGNQVTHGFTDTVSIVGIAGLTHTFTAKDAGAFVFHTKLSNPGTTSLTATDTTPGATVQAGSESNIAVINNLTASIAPTLAINGQPAGVPGQPVSFTLNASQAGIPASSLFTFKIDWNGNGKAINTVVGPNGTTFSHVYPANGSYTIKLTVSDTAGDVLQHATEMVSIASVALEVDPSDSSETALVIGAPPGAGNIVITPANLAGTSVSVSINKGSPTTPTPPSPFGHILVYSQAGKVSVLEQTATISSQTALVSIPAVIFGGTGTNTLSVAGSSADNILVGGKGANTLTGGNGRDILIGGGGPSSLKAGAGNGDTILIAGSTIFNSNLAALLALMAEWGRSDSNTEADYLQRVSDLFGTSSGGMNGSTLLNQQTVAHDTAVSTLTGNGGHDWFWFGQSLTSIDILKLSSTSGVIATRAAAGVLHVFL